MSDNNRNDLKRKNRRLLFAVVGIVGGMVGLSFASVPLYNLFCRVTGYGGTTQVALDESQTVIDRKITVRFDSSLSRDLPWTFHPAQRSMTMNVGENAVAFYVAENKSDHPATGQATFNVTPLQAGQYFVKVECFCFTEQRLEAGQSVNMPVAFYVDPAMVDDPDLAYVETITLSYTMFPLEEDAVEDGKTDDLALVQ
ncbi:MAG: cytochrome c oxidase assembly protein [Alphaproteobacteria bacterium]